MWIEKLFEVPSILCETLKICMKGFRAPSIKLCSIFSILATFSRFWTRLRYFVSTYRHRTNCFNRHGVISWKWYGKFSDYTWIMVLLFLFLFLSTCDFIASEDTGYIQIPSEEGTLCIAWRIFLSFSVSLFRVQLKLNTFYARSTTRSSPFLFIIAFATLLKVTSPFSSFNFIEFY